MQLEIPKKRYFKIGEVSQITGVEPHTIRYWESEFRQLKPRRAGSRQRLYRRDDVKLIHTIRTLLHDEKYTIAGAKKRLKSGPDETAPETQSPDELQAEETAVETTQAQTAPDKAEKTVQPEPETAAAGAEAPTAPRPGPATVKAKNAARAEDGDHPSLFPGLNRNGINSAGATVLLRVKTELEEILRLLS